MFQQYSTGDYVTFRHNDSTIIGTIRSRTGSLFAIETAAHEVFHVDESNIAGRVGEFSLGHVLDVGSLPSAEIWM